MQDLLSYSEMKSFKLQVSSSRQHQRRLQLTCKATHISLNRASITLGTLENHNLSQESALEDHLIKHSFTYFKYEKN